ncbi:CLCN3 [Cordylochernes scorpioides]|uniref:CLCN3 n=1 Tax=Cordylochernes scorpioides TaxID=51811 RepID=A0ABY6JVG0_9ARAC|nr:CLCN3 [Cordylochernes scorpioides]
MLEMVEDNPNWKEKVITGDETWVYGYDPETKRQSMEWKGKDEPRTKKSRLCKSKNKVLLVTFFHIKGIVHYEYLEEGQTINKESYLKIMRRVRESIRLKRSEIKFEQRICIKFCYKIGKSASETLDLLKLAFGN